MSDARTDGNVIDLRDFRGRQTLDSREREAERRKRADENRERDVLRLRRLEEAPRPNRKKGPVFRRHGDRIVAARANGEHVERARERGVSIGEIDEAFGGRSDRYRLAPGVDVSTREVREKAGGRLMQQARGYLRLAGEIARLTGENADDLKLEVVRRTSLWSSLDRPQGDDADAGDERAERLNLLIHELSRRVIRKEKLVELFKTLRRTPGAWVDCGRDLRGFVRSDDPCDSCLYPDEFLVVNCHEKAQPLPGVQLACLLAAELDVKVFPMERTEAGPSVGADGEAGAFPGTLRLFRDIRLVIGPTTSDESIGPMFESRPYCDLIPGRRKTLFGDPSDPKIKHNFKGIDLDSLPTSDQGKTKYVCSPYFHLGLGFDGWEKTFTDDDLAGGMAAVDDKDGLWSEAIMRRETDGVGDARSWSKFGFKALSKVRLFGGVWDPDTSDDADFSRLRWRNSSGVASSWRQVTWESVEAAHVALLLDRSGEVSDHRLRVDSRERERSTAGSRPEGIQGSSSDRTDESWFLPGTLAHDVERTLATGALERALLDDIGDIRRALDTRIEEWCASAEARDARLIAGWSADSTDEET